MDSKLPIKAVVRYTEFMQDGTEESIISIDSFDSVEAFRTFERDNKRNVYDDILLVFDVRNGVVIDGDLVRIARATGWR